MAFEENSSGSEDSLSSTTRRCLECSAFMVEVDTCHEDDVVYTWFECSGENCSGQWLEKSNMDEMDSLEKREEFPEENNLNIKGEVK
jgi:hypothetical protein